VGTDAHALDRTPEGRAFLRRMASPIGIQPLNPTDVLVELE